MKDLRQELLPIVKEALREDLRSGDITTKLTVAPRTKTKAAIFFKEKGIACGLELAHLAFELVDKKLEFTHFVKDGADVVKEQIIAVVEGKAESILKAERVALNFLSHLSGIATLTNQYVEKVKSSKVEILDTRKTTPTLRALEKYAVRCGGGVNHRMGLWDQVLIKDNHMVVSELSLVNGKKNLKGLITKVKKTKPKSLKLEVEVKTLKQLVQVLEAKPDIIMLDNFSLNKIKEAVKLKKKLKSSVKLEVSGGVKLKNVEKIASCGVERISVGELTHSAKALDVALDCV